MPGSTRQRVGLSVLATALAAIVVTLFAGATAPAQDLQSKLDHKRAQLSHARDRAGVLSTTIQRYGDQIDQLQSQVASLRNRIAIVQAQLARKEAELKRDRQQLEILRARLHRSLKTLARRLVAIYKTDQPDTLDVILNARGFDDMLTRFDYLRRIQDQDTNIAARVRNLRDRTRGTVKRVTAERNAIASRKADLERAQTALSARQSQLAAARSRQQDALAQVKQNEQDLEGDVSKIQGQIAAQIAAAQQSSSVPAQPAGPVPGAVSSQGLIWPVNGPVVSPFGPRTINGGYEFHPGIDIAVPTGTPIHAAAAGTVILEQPEASSGGYGNYTCIDHGGGLSTCYAHQESFAVSVGQHVSQGEVIGYSDCTGYCFGPHLHFEVRINGQVTDPMAYLP